MRRGQESVQGDPVPLPLHTPPEPVRESSQPVHEPAAPVYDHPPRKITNGRKFTLLPLIDGLFVILSLVLTLWLAGLLLIHGVTSWRHLAYLLVFWAVLAYLALPRLHQLFTWLYVPDYFIGRTRTRDGLLGDPVNLALEGEADDIHAAMQRAGWTLADEMTLRSAGRTILAVVLRRSYAAGPVSELFLFGRRHEFAYQQEVEGHPAQRHHVRFWRTPEGWALPGGQHVRWLAAGTYDRALGLSVFTGQFTHRIDADIDVERDYIIDTALYADPACEVEVIKEFSIAYHHRNGGGDRVHTDGDLPILDVTGADDRASAEGVEIQHTVGPRSSSTRSGEDRPSGEDPGRTLGWAEDPGRHHIPPPSLLSVGAILLVALVWSAFGVAGSIASLADGAGDWGALVLALLLSVLQGLLVVGAGVLWVETLTRRWWARLVLMTACSVIAFAGLVSISAAPLDATLSPLAGAGLAVGMVLALSADSAREWVRGTEPVDRSGVGDASADDAVRQDGPS